MVTAEQGFEPVAETSSPIKKDNDLYPPIRAYVKERTRLLEIYPVRIPYAYSTITFDQESHQIKYIAV